VKAVTGAVAAQWVTALVRCPHDVAARRIVERGTGDTAAARLRAWDETDTLPDADMSVNTAELDPADAAATIQSRVQALAAY
jgi:guanylate kinase